MRVCVLLPSAQNVVDGSDVSQLIAKTTFPDLGAFTDQHTFKNLFLGLDNWKSQIDAAVAEGYDFYFHFFGSTVDKPLWALEACRYFESLGLPWSGIPSGFFSFADQDKNLFCGNGMQNGSRPGEVRDMTCTVIQLAEDGLIALPPMVHEITQHGEDIEDSEFHVMRKQDDPALFERIQRASIDALLKSQTGSGNACCTVAISVHKDGTVVASNLDRQPAGFISSAEPIAPVGWKAADLAVTRAFPGGHRALIDVAMANKLLRGELSVETLNKLKDQYSGTAETYEAILVGESRVPAMMEMIVDKFDFSGVIFDLACGTGIFARALRAKYPAAKANGAVPKDSHHRVFGFDIAPGMLKICTDFGVYESVHIDSMEETLINLQQYAEAVDHVVCFTAIQLLRPETLSLFLVLAFALTNKSITFTVNEVPERYNSYLAEKDHAHMRSANHVKALEDFGVPNGWELVWRHREFAWTTPQTGDDIYSVIYRFERVDEATRGDLLFVKWE
uniref:Methyltransferase domain-containing protein n=1 Tax=Sordaria araneosa TaxID=573841 RepID=A0A1B4XBF9_SORAA|nr:hypothetical protein [Sordaria araneosa]